MLVAGGLNYTYGPLGALAGVAVLAVLLRWIYGSGKAAPPRDPEDFGLLVEVERVGAGQDAEQVRRRLLGAGVRSTLARTGGEVRVLVFPADADRARAALRG